MKIFLFGVGHMSRTLLGQIKEIPPDIDVLGFIDNDSKKWGSFLGKPVYGPGIMNDVAYDNVIIMSDVFYEVIREGLVYWYKINVNKIKNRKYLLQLLLKSKFKDSKDSEIQEIIKFWNDNEISIYNQYVKLEQEKYFVQWDMFENMPYIIYEDKKIYYPFDYKFQECEGKKVILDLFAEQQESSPHLYIKDDIRIKQGDVIVDAGVMEGNFSIRWVEKASKVYLIESDIRWIKPLCKTFEKFKDKVIICHGFLGQSRGGKRVNLDSIVDGRLDFLKMDIEGAEQEALLGGRQVLLSNDVKCAVCSYHKSGDEGAIRDIFDRYGYRTNTSKGYMTFYYDENIYSTLDFRRGIVYARKK